MSAMGAEASEPLTAAGEEARFGAAAGEAAFLPEKPVPIVPPHSVAGRALTLVVAIMSFLACLTVGGVSLVRDGAEAWQASVAAEVTIQVKPVAGADLPSEIERSLQIARESPAVERVRLLSERDTAKLLEPWLGSAVDFGALPVPRLIVVSLRGAASTAVAELKERLEREVKGASLDDHRIWTERLRRTANGLVLLGFVILGLVLTAMVLSVVFATRAAVAGNRAVIEVLHLVGAEDAFIAREFQRHFLVLGLRGGVVGGLVAVLFFLGGSLFGGSGGGATGEQMRALFGGLSVGVTGYAGTALVVLVVAGLTALTSRWTVRHYLAASA